MKTDSPKDSIVYIKRNRERTEYIKFMELHGFEDLKLDDEYSNILKKPILKNFI
jgi:hypothetical protein